MSVKPGIPIHQMLRGPDQDYTVANILNAFVRGETVTLYSFDGTTLVPNRVEYVARTGLEYMFQLVDENENFITCSSSQEVLTQEGLISLKELASKHKLVQPSSLGVEETGLKERKMVPKHNSDPTADERDFVYSIRLEDEPYNVVAGHTVLKAEPADKDEE